MIDKPAGLVVHPAPGHAEGTLVHALIGHCGESLSGIGGVRRPGIVHRLDKDTSGLLVVAKTDAAHQGLADLFADHGRSGSLTREYLAAGLGRIRPLGGQGRRRDRPAWAPSREDGGRAGRARPPRGHPLAGRGGVRAGEPDRLPAGDGTHPSDPGAHGLDRTPLARRFGLWRRLQDQGRPVVRGRQRRRSPRSTGRRCTPRRSASIIRSPASRCASKARPLRICRV